MLVAPVPLRLEEGLISCWTNAGRAGYPVRPAFVC